MTDQQPLCLRRNPVREGQVARMEEALPPLDDTDHPIRDNRHIIPWIAISVILHFFLSAILLGLPGGGEPPRPAVTYVDLKTVPLPQPVPAEKAPPEPEPVQPEPIPETPPPPQEAATEQPKAVEPPPVVPPKEEERSRTTFGMGLTKGYFRSLSDGESLRDDIKGYYLGMLQGINEKWWLEQKDQQVRPIVVNITVARNGEIVASYILQSSGNIVYDRAVQKSLEGSGPLPPLPPSFEGAFFDVPVRLVPPLNLMW